MFQNVGRKIQGIAEILFFLCMIVGGMAFLSSLFSDSDHAVYTTLASIAVTILSITGCLRLYGFGIIVENAERSLLASNPASTSVQIEEAPEPTEKNLIEDLEFSVLDTEFTAFVDGCDAPYGQKFFFIALDIENNSDEEKELSDSDFKFYANDEESPKTSFFTYNYLGLDGLYSTRKVAARSKMSFYLVAKVPENCDSVELTYQDSYTFIITPTTDTSSTEVQ